MGETLLRGGDEAQDLFIFAGSGFEAKGIFYALYTSFNRDYAKQDKASQMHMIATSTDLIHWNKSSEKLIVPQAGYDPYDWRDPYVF
jgi:beta-fructofuranosidase